MTRHVELRSGAYADSVTLLQVSRDVQRLPGVVSAQVAMATPLNLDVLTQMGFTVPDTASANDMVLALRVDEESSLAPALAGVEQALTAAARSDPGPVDVAPPRTTASALRAVREAVALVSVPGQHAAPEAMDALDAGHDVMIFSDNVPLDQEVALKRAATERGLLVMGPDCGTAVLGGLGLGFANAVSPGPVGIVAASGTGCQQVLCLLDRAGVGVSTAYGVGGRDLSSEVGGLSTRVAPRRRPDGRADPGDLQATRPGGRRRDHGVRRPPRDAGPVRPARTRPTRPDRGDRVGAERARTRAPRLAGAGQRAGLEAGRSAARPVRRRHPVRRGHARRRRAPRADQEQHPTRSQPRARPGARRRPAPDDRLWGRLPHRRPGPSDDRLHPAPRPPGESGSR
ncbi:hypothetical protein NOCA290042 [metagenome]|uniref:FdrA family protein n=1 Tax=metagenome TaxID=256318 RepID=A0A2P2CFX5_9ZZZZ